MYYDEATQCGEKNAVVVMWNNSKKRIGEDCVDCV